MYKSILITMVTVLALALTGSSMAGQLDQVKDKAEEVGDAATFRGEVVSVDLEDDKFTAKSGDSKEKDFHVAEDGKVMIDGRQMTLGDLAAGAQVTVTYITKDEKHMVMSIRTR